MKYYMYTAAGNQAVADMVEKVVAAVKSGTTENAASLLVSLRDKISNQHPEIFDTVVREIMWKRIACFIGKQRTETLADFVSQNSS